MKTVKIKDYFGKIHYVPVNDEVYEALRDIRREEDRLRKRTAYHRSRFSLDEYETGMRTGESDPIQEELIRKFQLEADEEFLYIIYFSKRFRIDRKNGFITEDGKSPGFDTVMNIYNTFYYSSCGIGQSGGFSPGEESVSF